MSISPAGIVDTARWITNDRNAGGTYDPEGYGYRFRIVLHTIEGSANPGVIAGHAYPPHLWYDPPTRALYQTVPLGRSAFALYQAPDAPHYTNRARALQVEISGRAAETGTWPQAWLDNLTVDIIIPLCRWVASQGGSINLNNAPAPGVDSMSATENAAQRFTPLAWALFDGLCSHRHVPMGDDHWDTGQLDTPRLAQHAAMIIGGQLVTTTGRTIKDDDDMIRACTTPEGSLVLISGGTYWAPVGDWPQINKALIDLDAAGVLAKHPNGGLVGPVTSTSLAQLKPISAPAPASPAIEAKLDAVLQRLAATTPTPAPTAADIATAILRQLGKV